MKTFIVYIATNTVNGKRYIGATSRGLTVRRKQHEFDAFAKRPGCRVLNSAIRKYGVHSFEWKIVFHGNSHEEIMLEEIRLITELKPEYNMTSGGRGVIGVVRTEEWIKKLSNSLKGRKLSEAHIEKMRNMDRSKFFKSIVCLNDGLFFPSIKDASKHYGISKGNLGGMLAGNHTRCNGLSFVFSGRPLTNEEIASEQKKLDDRISSWKERQNKDKRRPVICLTDNVEYESAIAAAKNYGIASSRVMQICQSGGSTISNLSFRYADLSHHPRQKPPKTEVEKSASKALVLAGLARGQLKIKKRVILYESGEIFPSITDAARQLRLNEKTLYRCIEDGLSYPLNGFTFRSLDASGNQIIVKRDKAFEIRKVICLDDLIIHNGINSASNYYGISRTDVIKNENRFRFLDEWTGNHSSLYL